MTPDLKQHRAVLPVFKPYMRGVCFVRLSLGVKVWAVHPKNIESRGCAVFCGVTRPQLFVPPVVERHLVMSSWWPL